MWQDLRIPHTGPDIYFGMAGAASRIQKSAGVRPRDRSTVHILTSHLNEPFFKFFKVKFLGNSTAYEQIWCFFYGGLRPNHNMCSCGIYSRQRKKKKRPFFSFLLSRAQLKAPLIGTHVKAATEGRNLLFLFLCTWVDSFKHARHSYLKDGRAETHARPTRAMCVCRQRTLLSFGIIWFPVCCPFVLAPVCQWENQLWGSTVAIIKC